MGEWKRDIDKDGAEAEALRTRMIALQPLDREVVRHVVNILPRYIDRVRELSAENEALQLEAEVKRLQETPTQPTAPAAELPLVVVAVEGGVVQDVKVPPGVRVIVRDYDVEDADEDDMSTDADGNECIETEWFADGSVR